MDPVAKLPARSLEWGSSARQDEVWAEVEPKICVCFPFSADIPVGGGHPSAMLLMRALHQRGIRPVLALHGPDGPAGQWLAQHGAAFPQFRFSGYAGGLIRNPGRDAAFVVSRSRTLARFLRQEGIQIVHANDIWMMMTWATAARLAGVKLVWHHRSMERYKLPHRLAFRAANKMIAVSPFAAGQRITDPKCIVIPDPFEPDQGRIDRGRVRQALLQEVKSPPTFSASSRTSIARSVTGNDRSC